MPKRLDEYFDDGYAEDYQGDDQQYVPSEPPADAQPPEEIDRTVTDGGNRDDNPEDVWGPLMEPLQGDIQKSTAEPLPDDGTILPRPGTPEQEDRTLPDDDEATKLQDALDYQKQLGLSADSLPNDYATGRIDWDEYVRRQDLRARPTLSAGGIGGDWDLDGNGVRDLQTQPPGVNGPRSGGGGSGSAASAASNQPSLQDILKQLESLGSRYGGPRDAGIFPEPTQQVGQDPLSQAITGGYVNLLGNEGKTALGGDMEETLRGLIARQGAIDTDPSAKAQRMEAARQPIEAFRRMQTNQARGSLANRGLLSEPGMPQGSEIGAMSRIEEQLAPYYATAGQNLASEDFAAQNERLSNALTLATGLSNAQAQTFLQTLGDATERQKVLSDIALQTLDRNIEWNKFLAELGLERDKIMAELASGKTETMTMLMTLFQQYLGAAQGGYI